MYYKLINFFREEKMGIKIKIKVVKNIFLDVIGG